MSFDEIFDLTAGVHFNFYNIYVYILQVPTTQLGKMSIDPKFVELTADVLEIFSLHTNTNHTSGGEKQNM